MIQNRTDPALTVGVTLIDAGGKKIAAITVPVSRTVVSSTDGKTTRRRLDYRGEPECVPLLPREYAARLAHFGEFDFTATTFDDLGPEALDPVERERLRRAIETYDGDRKLLKLGDDELDGALELVKRDGDRTLVTVAGLLLVGREDILRQRLPTHEVAFQVLDGTRVVVSEFFRWPLVRLFEQLETYYRAHVVEQEVQVGMFRVPVPSVDPTAFREAVINALAHRDYSRLGEIYVQWKKDHLSIGSPGGFVEGVTAENLLTVLPKPRNKTLALAFKRVGLAERTGRGVDLIYEGLVKYGRPAPSYMQSDATRVTVRFSVAAANLKFIELVKMEERRIGHALPLASLLILQKLLELRRASAGDLEAELSMLESGTIRGQLEQLFESGLIEAHGVKKGRTYTMSASLYRKLGQKAEYTRQTGISAARQKAMVLTHVETHGSIKREEVIALCGLNPNQATKLLKRLTDQGELVKQGEKRGAYYTKP